LHDRHATVAGSRIRFRFRAKSGAIHESDLRDRRLATLVKRCQELPGQELFQYIDADDGVHDITSDHVNAYLREAAGGDFTAKDVRTWAGTVLAFRGLRAQAPVDQQPATRRNLVAAMRATAVRLGNTPAVARGSYVHPGVAEAYLDGGLEAVRARQTEDVGGTVWPDRTEELALLRLLREQPRKR